MDKLGKTVQQRSLLSFPSFRRSSVYSIVPSERPNTRISRMSTGKENATSSAGLKHISANKCSPTQRFGCHETKSNILCDTEASVFGPQCRSSSTDVTNDLAADYLGTQATSQCLTGSAAMNDTQGITYSVSQDEKQAATHAALAFQRWRNVHLKVHNFQYIQDLALILAAKVVIPLWVFWHEENRGPIAIGYM